MTSFAVFFLHFLMQFCPVPPAVLWYDWWEEPSSLQSNVQAAMAVVLGILNSTTPSQSATLPCHSLDFLSPNLLQENCIPSIAMTGFEINWDYKFSPSLLADPPPPSNHPFLICKRPVLLEKSALSNHHHDCFRVRANWALQPPPPWIPTLLHPAISCPPNLKLKFQLCDRNLLYSFCHHN